MFTAEEGNSSAVEASLDQIDLKVVRNLLCFYVWQRKGRVEGVHPDFGRLSYIGSDKISMHYHYSNDDRVNLLLELTELISKSI